MSQGPGKTRRDASELIAALMKGPRTVGGLMEMTGAQENSIRVWLVALREAGVVRRAGRTPSRRGMGSGAGKRSHVFALQPSPFALPDTPLVDVPDVVHSEPHGSPR